MCDITPRTVRCYSASGADDRQTVGRANAKISALGEQFSSTPRFIYNRRIAWIEDRNAKPKPFKWTAKAITILENTPAPAVH
jgi:hypothetical protein